MNAQQIEMAAPVVAMSEVELEYAIDAQALTLGTAKTVEQRRAANEELCRLVKLRSREWVRAMETVKGLR